MATAGKTSLRLKCGCIIEGLNGSLYETIDVYHSEETWLCETHGKQGILRVSRVRSM